MVFTKEQIALILRKRNSKNQFVFAVMLKFFEINGIFPKQRDFELQKIFDTVGKELNLEPGQYGKDSLDNRSINRFKKEIRLIFGFKEATLADKNAFILHCQSYIFPYAFSHEQTLMWAYTYFKDQKLEPYSYKQLTCFLEDAHCQFEQTLFEKFAHSLSKNTKEQLDKMLKSGRDETLIEKDSSKPNINSCQSKVINFVELKDFRVDLKMNSTVWAIQKHEYLKQLQLPTNLENKNCSLNLLIHYYEHILTEKPSSIKRYNSSKRYAYLLIFCYICRQVYTDILADLFLKLLKRINTRAESYIDSQLKSDSKRVSGKLGTLLVLAKKSLDHPAGIIENTIYPTVSKERLGAIIDDLGENENWYKSLIKTKALSLYIHNNRKLLWLLADALTFDTEIKTNQQKMLMVLKLLNKLRAIETTCRGISIKKRLYNPEMIKPLIHKFWWPFVMATNNDKVHINWYCLELALFEAIGIELGIKNIWIRYAYRYRDPKEDFPEDFDEKDDFYFSLLNLPKDPGKFSNPLKTLLEKTLKNFDDSITDNPKVEIKKRKKRGAIKLTPFESRQEPQNLNLLKKEIAKTWPNLQLIDILKEAAYRIGFLDTFVGTGSREAISKDKLHKRLLLCIFGIGTNTGLKRVSSIAETGENLDDLRYVKKRYITCQNVRLAIQKVINALLIIRDPNVWGEGTTIGASDSKKLNVWDQNLMTEWHARYRGKGVMIYWHVKEGLCVHSMLKTCTSSEVGSMIKGVLHHDTLMDFDKISVDTHGQSAVGFAFSKLFGFELLPRIKDLDKQKLYISSNSKKLEYTNLKEVIASDPIVWSKINDNYRDIVKHAIAIKIRNVDPAIMLRRLSASNKSNPVYQALLEIGKASRTIFLCRYLSSEELRIEIQEALNVVERVNGLMAFIFYGQLGEISTNRTQEQELSLLCLHLLQVCMCYITTILIQVTLLDPKWKKILSKEDMRALSPLFHGYINPYGLLDLDMNAHIEIKNLKGEIYAQI